VYRNEPSDGAPRLLAVLSVGPRENLRADGDAVKSRAKRIREFVNGFGGDEGPHH